MRPGAPPKSCGYVYTGPGEVSSLVTDPPGTPVAPRIEMYHIKMKFYVCTDVPHTHPAFGRTVPRKMK